MWRWCKKLRINISNTSSFMSHTLIIVYSKLITLINVLFQNNTLTIISSKSKNKLKMNLSDNQMLTSQQQTLKYPTVCNKFCFWTYSSKVYELIDQQNISTLFLQQMMKLKQQYSCVYRVVRSNIWTEFVHKYQKLPQEILK